MAKWARNLLLQPYRLFFGTGVLYAILAMGVWAAWLSAPELMPSHASLSLVALHAHVMIYGVTGFYVFGFLLTAFARWANQPFPSPRTLLGLWGAMVIGQSALLGAVATKSALLAVTAAIAESGAYLLLLTLLLRWHRRSGLSEHQPRYVIIALISATAGVLLFYVHWLFPAHSTLQSASTSLGVYAYLLFLVVAITYRIVPYFAGNIVANYKPHRGKHTLAWVIGLITVRLIASLWLDFRIAWTADVMLAIVLAKEWIGWFARGIPRVPILFVLFIGFFWILVFLGFSGVELINNLSVPFGAATPLFRTPALHALLVGAFGTLLIAISTRVVRGHGGLPIRADAFVLAALLLMQTATLIRVTTPIAAYFIPVPPGLLHWAAGLWTLAFVLWAIRYVPVLGRPHIASP
jgi:uncharacterized protein involved in response to NO